MSADGLDLDALAARIDTAEENYCPVPIAAVTIEDARALIAAVRERDALVDGLRGLARRHGEYCCCGGACPGPALRDLLDRTTGTDDRSADA